MDFVVEALLALLSALALGGAVLNIATIVVLRRMKIGGTGGGVNQHHTSFNPSTKRLLMNESICGITIAVIAIPLRLWNIVAGAVWPFDRYGSVCSAIASAQQAQSVAVLIDFSIALTRLVAVVFPHHYASLIVRRKSVQVALNLMTWIILFFDLLTFQLAGVTVATSTPQVLDGICLVLNLPNSSKHTLDVAENLTLAHLIVTLYAPLGITAVIYMVIFFVLYRNKKKFGLVHPTVALGAPAGNVGTEMAIALALASKRKHQQLEQHRRRLRMCIVFACASALTVACVGSRSLAYTFVRVGRERVPFVTIYFVQCLVILVHPMLYTALFPDMRKGYWNLLLSVKRRLCCCCCCTGIKCGKKTTGSIIQAAANVVVNVAVVAAEPTASTPHPNVITVILPKTTLV